MVEIDRLLAAGAHALVLFARLLDFYVDGFDVDIGVVLVGGADGVGLLVWVMVGAGNNRRLGVVFRGQDVAAA